TKQRSVDRFSVLPKRRGRGKSSTSSVASSTSAMNEVLSTYRVPVSRSLRKFETPMGSRTRGDGGGGVLATARGLPEAPRAGTRCAAPGTPYETRGRTKRSPPDPRSERSDLSYPGREERTRWWRRHPKGGRKWCSWSRTTPPCASA